MDRNEIEALVESAIAAAHVGGVVLRDHARHLDELQVDEKAMNDFVTAADRASEKAVLGFLRDRYPDHAFLAEESVRDFGGDLHSSGASAPFTWVVDPLDGTTNFIHGYPVYSVSVGLMKAGQPIAGAVYDPAKDEMFSAGLGLGAHLGGSPIRIASRAGLGGCLLATGFPFKMHERLKEYLRSFEAFARSTAGIRRAGSAALDLCYTACGRFDGFWEMSLSPWDVAAGSLIVREAGGIVTDFTGRDGFIRSGNIVAANARVHAAMIEVLRRTLA